MYLRVYTSLRGLGEDEANQRYCQREKIEADLQAFTSAQTGSEPGHDSIIVSVIVTNPDVRYIPPLGWASELVDDLNDPDYSARQRDS
jgi:hypothetical protein